MTKVGKLMHPRQGFPDAAMRLASEHAKIALDSGDERLAAIFHAITRATFNGLMTGAECEGAVERLRELMAHAPAPREQAKREAHLKGGGA